VKCTFLDIEVMQFSRKKKGKPAADFTSHSRGGDHHLNTGREERDRSNFRHHHPCMGQKEGKGG